MATVDPPSVGGTSAQTEVQPPTAANAAPVGHPLATEAKAVPVSAPVGRDAASWIADLLKAGADLKVPGLSAVCNGLSVALGLAVKYRVATPVFKALTFSALALAVPATAALLLLGLAHVWPQAADTYTSLIRSGFSIRKSAEEAVTDDHQTLDYYQLLNVGLNTKGVGVGRQYQLLLAPRQRAALTFDLGRPEYLSAPGCPTEHSVEEAEATVLIEFGQEPLRKLTLDARSAQVLLDAKWWDQNEPKLEARGYPMTEGQFALPLRVSMVGRTSVSAPPASAPCVTINALVAIEVYKKKFPKAIK